MRKDRFINIGRILLGCLLIIMVSCEREPTENVEFAQFPQNGDVFIDAFSAGLDFFPFVDAGADPMAFSVVTDEVFSGETAMRFDVPVFGNGFVGATFNTTAARNLTGFDALTFYARASQAASIDAIGFGISGETNNRFLVTLNELGVSTRWEKYVIPIPDASKLIGETGLFWLAEGASFEGDEGGYSLFFDEIRFERLGTIAQPRPTIFDGQEITEQSFTGSSLSVTGLTQTFNLGTGENLTVMAAPAYFDFSSSDLSVAIVNELGEISVVGEGTAQISAQLAGVAATGGLELVSGGGLEPAPTPTLPQASVSSIFSDAYTNATESNFTPGFGGSTTETTMTSANGDAVLSYANNNFTGILFENTVDGSDRTFLHVDVFAQEPGVEIVIQIRDVGANQMIESDNNGNPIVDDRDFRFTVNSLAVGDWTSFDIPLEGDLATQKNNLGALILVGGPNFLLDNIYFFTE